MCSFLIKVGLLKLVYVCQIKSLLQHYLQKKVSGKAVADYHWGQLQEKPKKRSIWRDDLGILLLEIPLDVKNGLESYSGELISINRASVSRGVHNLSSEKKHILLCFILIKVGLCMSNQRPVTALPARKKRSQAEQSCWLPLKTVAGKSQKRNHFEEVTWEQYCGKSRWMWRII